MPCSRASHYASCLPRQELVIFTEHRDTLNYLEQRITTLLGRKEAVVTIHGGMSREERMNAQEAFKHDPEVQVLLATDAAGEGINLQRGAEITVTYLMRALGRCRRSIQRYLRLLELEGYIRVDVVHGQRTHMCTGLAVQLLAPLFPRHHADRWPAKLGIPGATQESQKKRFIDCQAAGLVRIPVQSWALRCMDGVFRSLMKTLPPPDPRLTLAA